MFYKLKKYDREYYKIYDKRRQVNWDTIPSFRWMKDMLQLSSNDRLLDVGCGDGGLLKYLCRNTKVKAVGVDISEEAVAISSQYSPSFDYCQADITQLPFPDNSFDKIVCFNVIEHIRDQNKAMAELKRVLSFNGVLVLGTPIRDSAGWWLYQQIIGDHTHTREFSIQEFLNFIEKNFKIGCWTKSSGVFRTPQAIRWIFHNYLKIDVLVKAYKEGKRS
jgi:ubiquinone/menaquinone biosynthesis C-methylase UbiE